MGVEENPDRLWKDGEKPGGFVKHIVAHRPSDIGTQKKETSLKVSSFCTLMSALCVLTSSLAFAGGPGTTTAELLKIPVGSRAIGMGEAYTALANDASAMAWNPAGLARVQQREANFMHSSLIEGVHYEHMAYVHPGDVVALGGSFSYLGYGNIDGYDNSGNATGNVSAYSYVLNGSVARQLTPRLSLGGSLQVIRQTLASDSAGTVAGNVGALYTLPKHYLSGNYTLGLSVLNLGPGLKFVDERDPLPRKIKMGAAASRLYGKPVTLTGDITMPNDNSTFVSLGSEYWFKEVLALRLGYAGSNDEGRGIRLGFGINWHDFSFDYAYGGFGDFGATHRIGFTYRFGAHVTQLNDDERAILKEARDFRKQGNYVQAILGYNELLEKNPDNQTAMSAMIDTHEHMMNKEMETAIAQAAPDMVPSPEQAALADLLPGGDGTAMAANPMALPMANDALDPMGLNALPDINGTNSFLPLQQSKGPAMDIPVATSKTNAGFLPATMKTAAMEPADPSLDTATTNPNAPALSALDIYGN